MGKQAGAQPRKLTYATRHLPNSKPHALPLPRLRLTDAPEARQHWLDLISAQKAVPGKHLGRLHKHLAIIPAGWNNRGYITLSMANGDDEHQAGSGRERLSQLKCSPCAAPGGGWRDRGRMES